MIKCDNSMGCARDAKCIICETDIKNSSIEQLFIQGGSLNGFCEECALSYVNANSPEVAKWAAQESRKVLKKEICEILKIGFSKLSGPEDAVTLDRIAKLVEYDG